MDDFLIQHTTEAALNHLVETLQKNYTITIDRQATKYCGMQLDWNYVEGHGTLSMPGYVEQALQQFMHTTPVEPQPSPHQWHPPDYGAAIQYAAKDNESEPLSPKDITKLQTNHQHLPLLYQSHRQHNAGGTWHTGSSTDQGHPTIHEGHRPTTKLCSNQPGRGHLILQKRHGAIRP